MDKVTRISPEPDANEAFITLTRETAPILLELLTKAAISGPQAHLLADLYRQSRAAADSFGHEA